MHVYVYVYGHANIQACLLGRSQALAQRTSRHKRSLTVPVEGVYFLGCAAVGSPKSDLPRQRLGGTHLPLGQSGSD